MTQKYKLSKKKQQAFNQVLKFYEDKDEDLLEKEQIKKQNGLANFFNEGIKKLNITDVKATQADISRLKNHHADIFRISTNNEGYYCLEKKHGQQPLDRLAESINTADAKDYFDASVLALKVDKIYADRLGVDFLESFSSEVLGYLKNENLLLIVFKSNEAKNKVKKELESRPEINF